MSASGLDALLGAVPVPAASIGAKASIPVLDGDAYDQASAVFTTGLEHGNLLQGASQNLFTVYGLSRTPKNWAQSLNISLNARAHGDGGALFPR